MPEREFGLIVLRSGSKSFASRKISDRRSLRARFRYFPKFMYRNYIDLGKYLNIKLNL